MKKSMTAEQFSRMANQAEELQEHNHKLKVGLILFMYIIALGISYLTYANYSSVKNQLLFKNAKIKKLEGQISLIAEIGLIFAYLIAINWILHFFLTTFFKKQYNPYINALSKNISNSMQHFVIFLGVFGYILTNDEVVAKKKQIVLFANWFILSRFLFIVLSLVDAKFKFNFKELGSTLGVLNIAIIILYINGWHVFDYL